MKVGPEDLALDRRTGERELREYEVDAPEWATLLDVPRHRQGPPRRHARLPQELPDDDLRLLRDADGRRRRARLQDARCTTSREAGHVPVISPMGNLPIVKDLVVDMDPFWAKFRAVDPYLQPGYNVPPAGREHVISQRADDGDPQGVALHQLRLLRLGVQRDGVEPGVPRARRRSRRRCASSAIRATARRTSGSRR